MDPQKRAEIEQMLRRDVASGNIGVKIKMPGENNSDELNDIVNYAPTSEYTTYDTGRRDNADNPIMSSDFMTLMMAQSYYPRDDSEWTVSGIANSVYNTVRDEFFSELPRDGSVEPIEIYHPYITGGNTEPPPVITTKDWLKGVLPESFQASKLYADYFYGEDEKREQIKKAHDLTGIRAETIANDPEVWEKVMKIVQRAEKLKKLPGMLDANGDLNMRRVYETMPYLKEIAEKHGTNEAVMMLHNAEGLRTVDDAYSNEFTRFYGSVWTGTQRGYYTIRRQLTYANAMVGRRKLTEDEQDWITALDKKMGELPEYSYGGVGQALGAMIGGAAENIPMIASSQGIGAIAGGITLAVTKNPTVSASVSRATAIAVMALVIGGNQYEENLSKLDAKGRAMYTPGEAAALSATQGLVEGAVEQFALQKIARTVFGGGEAKALRDIYVGAGAKDLAIAAESIGAQEAARTLIKDRILSAAKAGAITFNTELQEELAQQVSDMVIENMAQMALKGDDAEIASVSKILQKSTAAAIEAAPSIMGFGLLGFGGHVGAHTRPMLNARSHMENLIKDRLYRSVNENQHLMNTVEAVGDNLKNVQELQGKAPDLVNEMLDSQNRRYGMETTSVDIVSLNQEEGGAELVQEIVEANHISAEELQACADGTGMLPVKTSTLQQITSRLNGAKRKALFQNITKSADLFTDKQAQHEAKIVNEVLNAFKSKTEEEVGDSVDRYVESAFEEHGHRALARNVLLADVNHPAAEIKRRMNRLDADLEELTSATQNDGSTDAVAYLDSIKPEIEKINAQKAALEAIEGTIKSLQPGDVVATAELSPEARSVYHGLADQLGNAKSKKARAAARANALLTARYADRMAAIYSEVKGEPYTAADYMRDHLRVDVRAEVERDYEQNTVLHQAMRDGLNLDEQVSVVDLDAMTNDLKGKTDRDILAHISKVSTEDSITTVDFKALVGLPKDDDAYGQRHLVRGNANKSSDNRMARNITLSNFEDVVKNAVVVEIVPNTKKAPLTGLKGKKRQIQKRKNQVANYYRLMLPVRIGNNIKTLVIVAEEQDGVVSASPVPVTAYEIYYAKKPPLVAAPRPETGVSATEEGAPLTISIRDMLTGVKDADGNVYAQGELKGESYTAADYMRDYLRVDARAEGGRSEGIHQAAMKHSDAVNLKDFSRMMRSPDAESGSRNKKFLRMIAPSGAFVDVAQDDMIHMHNHHTEMTDEDFAVIQENMENFLRVHQDMTGKGDYGGKSILCKIKTPRGVAGVSYELLPMGRIFLKTAFFDNEHGIDNWITKNGTSKDLMNLETEKRGNAASMLTGHPSRTADAADSLTPSVVRPLSLPMIQEMLGVVNSKETFQQSAWHGSPYSFDTFDLGAIGTGEGAQAHGWGLYFAKDREVSDSYRERLLNAMELEKDHINKGRLYKVNIPDEDALIDEQKSFSEQHIDVRNAIERLLENLSDSELGNWSKTNTRSTRRGKINLIKRDFSKMKGRDIYEYLGHVVEGENFSRGAKLASKRLNEYGIKGITYDGHADGRCYVIFDDKAIQIIETYNQEVAESLRLGAIHRMPAGKRIITLFKTADQSTFMHEMAHNYLFDLRHIAELAPDSRYAKDLATVNEWAEWHEGAAEEYKDTPWAEEFRAHEAAIREAEKSGYAVAIKSAKERWRQERFARGFEIYLHEGKSPSKVLRGVFRRFKMFLQKIYHFVKNVGGRPSVEVEAVMARMIASEEEIKAAELDERYRPIEKLGGKETLENLLGENVADTYQKWPQQYREDAEDRLRIEVMKDLKKEARKEYDEKVEAERIRKREELESDPVYLAEAAIKAQGDNYAALIFFPSVEAYKKERAKRKSLETELTEHMDEYARNLDKEILQARLTDENIAEAMQTPKAYHRRVALEAAGMRAKERLMRRLDDRTQDAVKDVEDALKDVPEDEDLT